MAERFDPETRDLLRETAEALDQQIRALSAQGSELSRQIGETYVALLDELANGRFDAEEEREIRLSLSYPERKLLWVWARLAKLTGLRRDIGREAMRGAFDPPPPTP